MDWAALAMALDLLLRKTAAILMLRRKQVPVPLLRSRVGWSETPGSGSRQTRVCREGSQTALEGEARMGLALAGFGIRFQKCLHN